MYHAQAATHIDSLKIQIRCHTDIEVALQTQPGETQSHRQGILQHNKTMVATRHDFINVLRSRELHPISFTRSGRVSGQTLGFS